MTKRYCYRDPLAAAWMAKHFGMRFQIAEPCLAPYNQNPLYEIFIGKDGDLELWNKTDLIEVPPVYPIHPNDYHLLEPRVGDYGGDGDVSGKVTHVTDTQVTIAVPERHNGKCYYIISRERFIIEKRQGIAFIAPEEVEG